MKKLKIHIDNRLKDLERQKDFCLQDTPKRLARIDELKRLSKHINTRLRGMVSIGIIGSQADKSFAHALAMPKLLNLKDSLIFS